MEDETEYEITPSGIFCFRAAPNSAVASDETADPDAVEAAESWELTPVQQAFIAASSRFSIYVGGVGAGKTFAGAVRALIRALDYPGSLGLIGAPTYPMLRDATQRTVFSLLPTRLIAEYHKAEGRLWLTNGAEILFRSLDQPDRARGMNLAWFWLDEAPHCGHYAWQVLKGRLRQRGFPTAAWATGTPCGRDGYWRDFEQTPRRNHQLFRASTYDNQRNLPPDFIEELGYTGAFREQEVMGLFVSFEGLVYAFDTSDDGNIREALAGKLWKRVIGGVDWGYTHPTAAVVMGIDGDGRAWQLGEFYQRRASLEDVVAPALLDLTRRYHVDTWWCGPDEPEHIDALAAALASHQLPARALRAQNAVRPGIQTVTHLLARRADGTRGLYVSPRCTATLAEYARYQYAAGGAKDGAALDPSELPVKQHDDAMDATRYALHSAFGADRTITAYLARIAQRQPARADEEDGE